MIAEHARAPFSRLLALICSLWLAGCAGSGTQPGAAQGDATGILAQRALARWEALMDGDFASAYALESPGYREATPLRLYASRFGSQLRWDQVEVLEVLPDPEGDAATVRLLVEYTAMDPTGGVLQSQRPVAERWIRTGGEWWHIND
jgi:hypothetical protein